MTCVDIRDKLAELSMGVLGPSEARQVARHLEWCPGCRKELEELREGMVAFGMAQSAAQPPPALEERVVQRLQTAAGRVSPSTRRGFKALAVATVVAMVLAASALAWAVAERHTATSQHSAADRYVRQLTQAIRSSGTFQAELLPTGTALSGKPGPNDGRAVIYSAHNAGDFVLVDVFLGGSDTGPYTFKLLDKSGGLVSGGPLARTNVDEWVFFESTQRDLSGSASAQVIDGLGRIVLIGPVRSTAR